jgi:hypothetical protein
MIGRLKTIKRILLIPLIAAAIIVSFASLVVAQESDDSAVNEHLPVIDRTFFIEGDKFTFKETEDGIISIWEGNVRAYSEQIELKTEYLELELTQDDQIRSLRATPEVTIELVEDAAQAVIRGKEFDYNFETGTGKVIDSIIELKANPEAFDFPVDTEYTIYILADYTTINNGDLNVEHPKVLLNSIDNPEVMIRGKKLTIAEVGDRRYLKIKNLAVYVFGIRVLYCPWTYRRSLTHKVESGFTLELPRLGYSEDGFEIDQRFYYAFGKGSLEHNYILFRMDLFTNDRWYPETGFGYDGEHHSWDILYGHEHEQDVEFNTVRVSLNPDFNWKFHRIDIFNRFMCSGGFNYGFIEEPQRQVDRNRLGFHFELKRKPIPLGNPKTTLNLGMKYRKAYYSGDDQYEVCTRSAGFKHVEKGKFSFATTYHHREDKGASPFLYDVEEILDEISFRTRIRLADRWGTGFDGRYDIEKDHFRDLELLLSHSFKSFQISIVWDFADGAVGVEFGLPGAL